MIAFYLMYFISFFGSPVLSTLRYIAILYISAVFLVIFLLSKNEDKQQNRTYSQHYFILVILAFLFTTLAATMFFSNYKMDSIMKYVSLLYLIFLIMFIMPYLINLIGIRKNNWLVIWSILLSIFISFLIRPNGYSGSGGHRIGGKERLVLFFDHPNTLGLMCFFGIVLIICNLYTKTGRTLFYIFSNLFMILTLLFILYLTDSRTSIYSLIIISVIFFNKLIISKIGARLQFLWYLMMSNGLLILFIFSLPKISYEELDLLLSSRLSIWTEALTRLINNKTLFIGEGAYRNSVHNGVGSLLIDNGYVNLLYQNGAIALFLLLLLLSFLFKLLNNITNYKERILMQILFITFLVISIFENILFNLASVYCILVYSYIFYYIKYQNQQNKESVLLA